MWYGYDAGTAWRGERGYLTGADAPKAGGLQVVFVFFVRPFPAVLAPVFHFRFVLFFLVGPGGQLLLELVYRVAGLGHEAAQVTGHPRERVGAKDHQNQEADYDDLLAADAKHGTIITLGRPPYDRAEASRVL